MLIIVQCAMPRADFSRHDKTRNKQKWEHTSENATSKGNMAGLWSGRWSRDKWNPDSVRPKLCGFESGLVLCLILSCGQCGRLQNEQLTIKAICMFPQFLLIQRSVRERLACMQSVEQLLQPTFFIIGVFHRWPDTTVVWLIGTPLMFVKETWKRLVFIRSVNELLLHFNLSCLTQQLRETEHLWNCPERIDI